MWPLSCKMTPDERQMQAEINEASTQRPQWNSLTSSETECALTFPEPPNSERTSSKLIPTPLLRQASCQFSSLSGQVTLRTPEGSHSPQMAVPGKNSRPKDAMSQFPRALLVLLLLRPVPHIRMVQCKDPWCW